MEMRSCRTGSTSVTRLAEKLNETHLDGISETGIQQPADGFADSERQLLRSKRQQVGERDDGQEAKDKDENVILVCQVKGPCDGDEEDHEIEVRA